MAIALYANGIIEEFKPKEHVFIDDEIIRIFGEEEKIRTKRLIEVPNTWCIWGDKDEKSDDEFSGIASNMLGEPIFSLILFIHDTEVDPNWLLTDKIIYKDYENFHADMMSFIDHIAQITIQQQQDRNEIPREQQIQLQTRGTKNKKVLFEFILENQYNEFFLEDNFIHFAWKVVDYLGKQKNKFAADGDMIYLYEDAKMIMYTEKEQVEEILESILDFYEKKEEYKDCAKVKTILDKFLNEDGNTT